MTITPRILALAGVAASIAGALSSGVAVAQNARAVDANTARVVDYWTSERRASAIPRDLVIDPRGLGYLRRPDGSLVPHGHDVAAQAAQGNQAPVPRAKPGGGSGDTTPPTITNPDPAVGTTIGASYTFSATVTDNVGGSGVKSATFRIQKDGSIPQS